MTERSKELVWSQMVDEGNYSDAEKIATGAVDIISEPEFTDITSELMGVVKDLTLALMAASDFLKSPDQPSSLAESILCDIDYLQGVLSQTIGLEAHTAQQIADITPRLEAVALQRIG